MSIITLKESFNDNTILARFPKPNYSHISENITLSDPIWIKFKDIFIDEDLGNVARSNTNKVDLGSRVQALKESFAAGVIVNQDLGAVEYRGLDEKGDEYAQPYIMKYGYGRTLAQIELGAKGWAFNVITGTVTEIEDACSFENEDPLPKSSNKELDIINLKSEQIRKGTLANDENIILANIRKTYPRRKEASINRIKCGIYEQNKTSQKYGYLTEAKIILWGEQFYSGDFAIKGNLDDRKDEYGFTGKKGGCNRTFYRALHKFADTGKTSYLNAYSGQVSKGSTLEGQRAAIINEYIGIRVNYAITFGKDVKFLTLNGFFPQIIGEENWYDFILIDQDDLEARVARSIKAGKTVK